MSARNGPDGYGWVTRLLHWLTVVLVAAQLTVGYLMDAGDSGRGRGRGGDHGGSGRGRGRGGDYLDEPDLLVWVHVGLGATILAIGLVRLGWRRVGGLPPWSDALSPGQRRLAHVTERVLLALLLVVPLSGIALVASGDDDLVWWHVGAHLAFFVALGAHLFTNLRPVVLRRML